MIKEHVYSEKSVSSLNVYDLQLLTHLVHPLLKCCQLDGICCSLSVPVLHDSFQVKFDLSEVKLKIQHRHPWIQRVGMGLNATFIFLVM